MSWEIREGDVLDRLREMPDESVHCVVTSPPYWGLRDYGTAEWVGGDPDCDHKPKAKPRALRPASGLTGGKSTVDAGTVHRDFHCGATRVDRQLGLEPTPDEFVAKMVEVFREVRRVLRADGTLWLNLGDSYAGGGMGGQGAGGLLAGRTVAAARERPIQPCADGLKSKDLVGIPWRVALALQADGWWLRQDIIWHKPNPMPESVRDRCTKAHEYVFLLTKSARYHYDADAIAEPSVSDHPSGNGFAREHRLSVGGRGQDEQWETTTTRNRRSVWSITTKPYSGAHFATFPPELPELCIKAGTSERGCCAECGAPLERMVERSRKSTPVEPRTPKGHARARGDGMYPPNSRESGGIGGRVLAETVGWQKPCECEAETVPCTVLDPFSGAGTTGLVALRLGRSYVGIELNPEYAKMSRQRIDADCPLFNRTTEGAS